jgi:hypothetical protein
MLDWLRFLQKEVQSVQDLGGIIADTCAQAVASRLPQRVIFWSVARVWASADRKAEDFAMLDLLPAARGTCTKEKVIVLTRNGGVSPQMLRHFQRLLPEFKIERRVNA